MNMTYTYKQLHESLMQNHNGTSIWENIMIITPGPILVYFVCLVNCFILKIQNNFMKQTVLFTVEFLSIIGVLILNLTVLSDYIYIELIFLVILNICTTIFLAGNMPKEFFNTPRTRIDPIPYFTYFRSIVSVMTCICILAVDFHIFPRRLAKTESYGFGLMDTGVGFYIVANGIVIKQNGQKVDLKKSLMSCLPILVLGIIRYASLESLDYQKHVSEYGIHWNFFFTLASVKIISVLLMYIFPRRLVLMAIFIALSHQILLFVGAENWVLENSPRSGFISANKEGLVSLPGYISLYLSSIAIGKFLNRPTVRLVDDIRHGINTLIWSITFLILTLLFYSLFNVSRRLANLTYISWMLTMSLYSIALSIFMEVALRISYRVQNKHNYLLTPNILNAVNYNSLAYFLISNLLTGVVNLIFQTFNTNTEFSLIILIMYQFCSCMIVYLLHLKKIKIKLQ